MSSKVQKITPEALFNYVVEFQDRASQKGDSNLLPSFHQVAKRFSTTYDEIESAILDYQGDGYLGEVVGFRGGMGGIAEIKTRGDHLVEAYN